MTEDNSRQPSMVEPASETSREACCCSVGVDLATMHWMVQRGKHKSQKNKAANQAVLNNVGSPLVISWDGEVITISFGFC